MTGPMHVDLGALHPVLALDEGHAGVHTGYGLAVCALQGVLVTSNVDNSLDVFSLSVTHVLAAHGAGVADGAGGAGAGPGLSHQLVVVVVVVDL